MHPIQKKVLMLISDHPLVDISIRQIGLLIGVEHPQMIKHHIEQLEKKGLAKYNKIERKLISLQDKNVNSDLLTLPVYGSASCGQASAFADNYVEGYVKISRSLLKKTQDIIVLEASGDSMNAAKINDQHTIEDGDYVVVDTAYKSPRNGDYIVSIIDNMANIKKFILDADNHQVVLLPESTKNHSPIFLGENELDSYSVCGKVLQVIKRPKY